MLITVIVNLLGIVIFLYVFWKKLKEDYISEQIFPTTLFILFGIGVSQILSFYLLPVWWFWLAIIGISLGFAFGVYRYKLRFYESLEALVISLLPWLSLIFLQDAIVNGSWFSLSVFIFIIFTIALYLFLCKQYKRFRWYKSGRVGFAGLMTLGFIFLIRGLTALWAPFMLSFVGVVDAFISITISIVAFGMVYNLSRSKI